MAKKIALYVIVYLGGVGAGLIGGYCAVLGYEEARRERADELKEKFSNLFS